MNGALAVARYTLIELSRRRILLVFFIIGAGGIAVLGTVLKVFSSAIVSNTTFGGPAGSAPDPAKVSQVLELSFVSDIIGVLGIFALLIAFGIGMTAIYHDLDSGAAVAILSKPVSRLAFTTGKLLAAVVAMIVVVGLLSLEARVAMLLFGGGLEEALWFETLAGVANAITLMLIVLSLSTWMNNIVAAVVAFIYNAAAGIIVSLHAAFATGTLGNNQLLGDGLNVLYWFVPHALLSDAPREIARQQIELFNTGQQSSADVSQALASIPGPSGATDIGWWVFIIVVLSSLVYLAVRRRQV